MSVLEVAKPQWMTEEMDILTDAARKFFERECAPHYEQWEEDGLVDREVWRKAGAAGLLCAEMPMEYGGSGGSFAHDAIIAYERGRLGLDGFGFPLHSSIVAPYILNYGSEEQKQRWLPRMASGDLVGAIAMSEPGAGSDLQSVKTSAKRDGNHYVINGQKTFITNGQQANLVIVVTKTDPKAGARGTSLFVIETDEVEGFERGRNLDKIGLKSNDTSELFFNDVRVPADALLGPEQGQGFYQLMEQLPQERLLIAVQSMATIELALEQTVDYVRQRKAFGKRIIDFQNTQMKLAECTTEATVAKVFLNHCIGLLVEGQLSTEKASMAKYWMSDLQCKIVDECLQLHGGYGYMNEFTIARLYRDSRVQRIYGGTNEIMKLVIARSLDK
jgi:acyl-CoA dehydrogenase